MVILREPPERHLKSLASSDRPGAPPATETPPASHQRAAINPKEKGLPVSREPRFPEEGS
jgi:hypothetical protein